MTCSFCRSERRRLVKGPSDTICEFCVARAIPGSSGGKGAGTCSFCGRPERVSRFPWRKREIVLANAEGNAEICSQCLKIARSVLKNGPAEPDA